jgi:hypothetical protein
MVSDIRSKVGYCAYVCLYAIYGPLSEATGLTLDNINTGSE